MKRILLTVLSILMFTSLTPPPSVRQIKEFDTIGELTRGLMDFNVLNTPTIKIKDEIEGVRSIISIMDKPYVDVIVHDDYYGDIFIRDDILRYIVHTVDQHRVDLFLFLCMIQHDNTRETNPSIDSDDDAYCRSEIYKRVKWLQRVEALGVSPQNLFYAYKELPNDFFR